MKKATREWLRKAENDCRLAATIKNVNEPFHDQVCFLCQQSAEKYLKALLEELGQHIPKTHDLEHLLMPVAPVPSNAAITAPRIALSDGLRGRYAISRQLVNQTSGHIRTALGRACPASSAIAAGVAVID